MRRSMYVLSAVVLTAALVLGAGSSLAGHVYEGVEGCKMCHKKEATGDQYGKWAASAHAKAYETLKGEAAKKIMADKGLSGNAWETADCLKCHVTGHGAAAEFIGKKYTVEEGVGCESCHGAGGDYKSMKVMKDRAAAVAAGMVVPTEETCKGCHNDKSPTFKGFEYKAMWAKIAHPNPEKAAGK